MLCYAAERQKSEYYVLTEGLTLEKPIGVKVSRQIPVEDFEISTFRTGINVLRQIYVGHFPDFPHEKGAGPVEKGTINGLKAESVKIHKTD